MHKIWLVIKREYKTRVVSKGFLISTIAIPALFGGMILFEAAIASKHPARTFKIAVADETGSLGSAVSRSLTQVKLPGGLPEFEVTEIIDPSRPGGAPQAKLEDMARSRGLDGILSIPRGILTGEEPELVERNAAILNSVNDINKALSNSVIATRLQTYGVHAGELGTLLQPVKLRVSQLTGQGKTEGRGPIQAIAIIMAFVLYGALMMYGITTMRSVLEEKTTRTMEVLISSVRPVQLMAGKILGVAAVGLTQFIIWAVSAALLTAYGFSMSRSFGQSPPAIHIPVALLIYFVVFFLGGYLLYASMFAAVGAAVSDHNDAHQIQAPVVYLLVASVLLFGLISRDPNSTTAVVLTLIPFFSPVLMVYRIALQTPPLWQILLSLFILALTTAGIVYATARIYRVGVLMYGKRPSLLEIIRWMRYS
ncbi:MAG: ABC transporter permease [Terriglobia bacterium]